MSCASPTGTLERRHGKASQTTPLGNQWNQLSPIGYPLRLGNDGLFGFPAELWAKVVIDFSVAYNKGPGKPEHIVLAMTPLYYGRAGSMSKEMQQMTSQEAEEIIRAQAEVFEDLKPYLMKRWDTA